MATGTIPFDHDHNSQRDTFIYLRLLNEVGLLVLVEREVELFVASPNKNYATPHYRSQFRYLFLKTLNPSFHPCDFMLVHDASIFSLHFHCL